MTGRPHVIKHAGSDVGRLLMHPQMRGLYDHILAKATRIVTGGIMAKRFLESGIDRSQLFLEDDFRVPDSIFCPEGDVLDLTKLLTEAGDDLSLASTLGAGVCLRSQVLGVYGKLGESKGTYDLLHAVKHLRKRGHALTLVVMGHGFQQTETEFRQRIVDLDLTDSVIQVPFVPHWRVPEFIRMCDAVCFLERDFPIGFHAPTVPREVFACAKCLIGSSEVLQRQIMAERLVHRFNCLAVRDVQDTEELADVITIGLGNRQHAEAIGRRGHEYSMLVERKSAFPRNYEQLFADAIKGHDDKGVLTSSAIASANDRFMWTRRVVDCLPTEQRKTIDECAARYGSDDGWALSVYAGLLELIAKGELASGVLIDAVRMEMRLAGVHSAGVHSSEGKVEDGLFRLEALEIPTFEEGMEKLYPILTNGLELDEYEFDVREMLSARVHGELPIWASRRHSCAVVVPAANERRCRIYWLSPPIQSLLELCDGTRSIGELKEIIGSRDSGPGHEDIGTIVMEFFRLGLIRLIDVPVLPAGQRPGATDQGVSFGRR
jgi:hypothetical protein